MSRLHPGGRLPGAVPPPVPTCWKCLARPQGARQGPGHTTEPGRAVQRERGGSRRAASLPTPAGGDKQHRKHRPSSWGCMHCPSPSPPRLQDQHRWNRESSRRVPGTDGLLTPQPLSAVPCWLGLRAVLLHSHADYECKTNSSLQGLMGGNPDHRIAPAKEVLAIVACLIQGI